MEINASYAILLGSYRLRVIRESDRYVVEEHTYKVRPLFKDIADIVEKYVDYADLRESTCELLSRSVLYIELDSVNYMLTFTYEGLQCNI